MAFQIERDVQAQNDAALSSEDNRTGRLFASPMEARYGPIVEELALPSTDDEDNPLPRIEFRLYDDDGDVYYEGWLHDDWNCDNQLTALTWAMADSGCTTIKVRRGNEWKQEIG